VKKEFLRFRRYQINGVILSAIFLLLLHNPAEATIWTVTNTGDDPANPAAGTLRHAIQNAWANDTITFQNADMEIQLQGELPLSKAVTIMGSSTIIRQTAANQRVFSIGSDRFVKLSYLTITGGNASDGSGGGAILNRGHLTLYRCTLKNNTSNTNGGAVDNCKDVVLNITTLENNIADKSSGGGFYNRSGATLTTFTSTFRNNTSAGGNGGGLANYGNASLTSHTSFSGNSASRGGGIYNSGNLSTASSTISSNQANASSAGGGIENHGLANITQSSSITGNTPLEIVGTYTTDGSCTIGTAPGKSSVALAGMASGASPQPRSTAGESDVTAAERDLGNSQSTLYEEIQTALSGDLRGIPGNLSASLQGMNATLYNAFAYENIPLEDTSGSGELEVEFTASWPKYVRYYAAFALAEEDAASRGGYARMLAPGSYVLPEGGIQFEIQPGQNLPDGVTPPDFYETGEGLRTWRNTVTDNGSFDLNPEAGVVTFRVCSVRAEAEAPASGGGSGGCNAGAPGASGLSLLLLGLPLAIFRLKKK